MTNLGTGGSAYNAQLKNSASISTSIGSYAVGTGAATFSAATSDYIQINNQSLSFGTNGMSFAFWFRANGVASQARILDFGNGAGIDNVLVHFTSNTLGADVFKTPTLSRDGQIAWGGGNMNDNTWRHAVWTINSSSCSI